MRVIWLLIIAVGMFAGCGEVASVGIDTGFDKQDVKALISALQDATAAVAEFKEENTKLQQNLNKCDALLQQLQGL